MRHLVVALSSVAATVMLFTPAQADDVKKLQEQVERLSERALQLEAVIRDLETARVGEKKKKDPGFPPVQRGDEHKVLESLVGNFDAKVKLLIDPKKPHESTGVMTRKMILGGNFLQESFAGEFLGSKFAGLGIIGYDSLKKKYVNTWCDSMSTRMTIFEGTYNAEKKTFTQIGEDYDAMAKKTMKARDVLTIVSDDVQTLEMYRLPDGADAEIKIMEITFTRKK